MFPAQGTIGAQRVDAGFLSKYAALLDIVLRVGDIAMVIAAAMLAARLRFEQWGLPASYATSVVRATLLTTLLFPALGLYRSWRGASLRGELGRLALAWVCVALGLLALAWALKTTEDTSRLWMGYWFIVALALFVLNRLAVRGALGLLRAHGMDLRRVVLVGATEAGSKILHAARTHPGTGLEVIGYVATPYDQAAYADLPCLGNLDSYMGAVEAAVPDQLWIALPMRAEETIRTLLDATDKLAMQVRLVPDFFGYELINHHSTTVAGVPMITLRGSRVEGHARIAKAVEDRLLALAFIVLLSPLMLLIALAVKLSSPGPILFRQKRHGLGGREIEVWKFRSMLVHEERAGIVTQATRDDRRITAVGRFLRRSSLDELPQLINVLQGRMSLVGPRPHAVEHNREFSEKLRGYMQRHGMKPGITGLAQVNGCRGETDTLGKMEKRIEYDLIYILNWSIWLDLKIVVLTPLRLLRDPNAY